MLSYLDKHKNENENDKDANMEMHANKEKNQSGNVTEKQLKKNAVNVISSAILMIVLIIITQSVSGLT